MSGPEYQGPADVDEHGECAAEIAELRAKLRAHRTLQGEAAQVVGALNGVKPATDYPVPAAVRALTLYAAQQDATKLRERVTELEGALVDLWNTGADGEIADLVDAIVDERGAV